MIGRFVKNQQIRLTELSGGGGEREGKVRKEGRAKGKRRKREKKQKAKKKKTKAQARAILILQPPEYSLVFLTRTSSLVKPKPNKIF